METTIATLISTIGFPIVAYLMMFKLNKETMEDLRKTIENNTLTITKMIEKIDVITNSNKEEQNDGSNE